MSMIGVGSRNPRVTIETSTGVLYDVPIYGLDGQAAPMNMQPIDPFDQINVIGDTAKALDRRVDRVIPADQTLGAGRNKYDETEGVTDFRESDADTRFKGAIVCRRQRNQNGTLGSTYTQGQHVNYTGLVGATLHSWSAGEACYYWSGAAWTLVTGPVTAQSYVYAFGYVWVINGGGNYSPFRSADGITFNECTLWPATFVGKAVGSMDNKLWVAGTNAGGDLLYLWASINPTATAVGTVAFTVLATAPLLSAKESIVELIPWKDGSGSPAMFILTSQRLLVYNAVGATIEEYINFRENNPEGGPTSPSIKGVCGIVLRSTGDLYLGEGEHNDYLTRYSPGSGFGKVLPNKYGGLSLAFQGSVRTLAQNAYGVGVWCTGTSVVGGSGVSGVAWFLTPDGGWHSMNRDISATKKVWGGGIGGRKFYTVFSDGTVEAQELPNVGSYPQFAIGSAYEINTTHYHNYARTDFGTDGTRFALLGFDVAVLKSDGSDLYGMDAGARLLVDYKLNGSAWVAVSQYKDTTGVVRTLAGPPYYIDPSATNIGFPLRLVVNNEFGFHGEEVEWRVGLRTTNSTMTPVLVYCAPRAKKTPLPHYTYEFVVNALDFKPSQSMALGGPLAMPSGRAAGGWHESMEALDVLGEMVKLTYGVGGEMRSDICEFAMAPQIHPQAGVGRYRISLRSVSSDPSG